MTREEMIAHFRNRPQEIEDYTDIHYYSLKVEICEINVDDEWYLVPKSVGQAILKIIENPAKNNEMIPIGNMNFRAYLVKTLQFRKEEFGKLSDWSKSVILKEQPDLFKEWENKFSPMLKAQIEKLKINPQEKELKPISNLLEF